jgi:hypothetical protein
MNARARWPAQAAKPWRGSATSRCRPRTARIIRRVGSCTSASVDEEYRLTPTTQGGTTLITDDDVRARIPGLHRLASRLTEANVRSSMARLKAFCERSDAQ